MVVVALEETHQAHSVKMAHQEVLVAAVVLLALEDQEQQTKEMLVVEASTQETGEEAAVAVLVMLEQLEQHPLEVTEATELHLLLQVQVFLGLEAVGVEHLVEVQAVQAVQGVAAMVRDRQLPQHNRLELRTRVAVVAETAFP